MSCAHHFYNRCKDTEFDPRTYCADTKPLPDPTTCNTCRLVKDVIASLNTLVFHFPFLETVGAAGVYDLEEWERDDVEKTVFKSKRGKDWQKHWEDEAESRDERHKVAEKLSRMGLTTMADEREAHQGFSMALTPPHNTVEAEKENIKPLTTNDSGNGSTDGESNSTGGGWS
ncbi:hypothetical protein H2198_004489 [Neophaeococcomyces mojaviensis]|uniref:Uncharacterized protein n=1 Tax=Neophaeococcomyces mojaviensis TaxID=3383035 RepID=A0ACC3A8A6_9EURO|nr:hypothetical protein H2198_004489 [Knufia sp. JES_112]